jgi:hypothetical protein
MLLFGWMGRWQGMLRVAVLGLGLSTVAPISLAQIPGSLVNVQSGNYTIQATDCGVSVIATGAFSTITLPSGAKLPANCVIRVTNGNSLRAQVLSGFPSGYLMGCGTGCLYPGQDVIVAAVAGSWKFVSLPAKWRAPRDTVLYVDPDGDDTHDGLGSGPANALASINAALAIWNSAIDCSLSRQLIALDSPGTYTGDLNGVRIYYAANCGSNSNVQISGAGAGGHNAVIVQCNGGVNCFDLQEPATATIVGLTINATGSGAIGLRIRQGATGDAGDVQFSGFPSGQPINVTVHGHFNQIGALFINGGASDFAICDKMSFCQFTGTIDISGHYSFGTFLVSVDGSDLDVSGVKWTGAGAGTGTRGRSCFAESNGIIHTGGKTLPGNPDSCGAVQTISQGQILK